jgi:ketosteroid isomerase-like protein
MRRDYFALNVRGVDWIDGDGEPRKPTLQIDFRGPEEALLDRLADLDAADTDVAFRVRGRDAGAGIDPGGRDADGDEGRESGVLSVTNRLTGDFVLEVNTPVTAVERFVDAARAYGRAGDEDGRYRLEIRIAGDPSVAYEKRTFLVYDADGELLRGRSLIPSGVEL